MLSAPAHAERMGIDQYLAYVKQQAASHERSCPPGSGPERSCVKAKAAFTTSYMSARLGDLRGQEDVAFYLAGSAPDVVQGGIKPDIIEACAWWLIIDNGPQEHVTYVDHIQFLDHCHTLSSDQLAAVISQAKLIAQQFTDPVDKALGQ